MGAYIGSQIALLVAGNNKIVNLLTSTALSTAGEIIAQEITSQRMHGDDLTSAAISKDFFTNVGNAVGGLAGSVIFAAVGLRTPLEGFVGATVGAAVVETALANLPESWGITVDASSSLLDNLGSGFAGGALGAIEAVTGFNPGTVFGNSQESQIAASVGGLIGSIVLSGLPGFGTVVGQFVGGAIGSIFASDPPPAGAAESLQFNNQRFSLPSTPVWVHADHVTPASYLTGVENIGATAVAEVNAELDVVGGSVALATGTTVAIGLFGSGGVTNFLDMVGAQNYGSGPQDLVNGQGYTAPDYSSAVGDTVIRQLALLHVAGANAPFTVTSLAGDGGAGSAVSALTNSLLAHDMNYQADAQRFIGGRGLGQMFETVNQLNDDLQAVADFSDYQQNKVAFLVGFAARETQYAKDDVLNAQQQGLPAPAPRDAVADWNAEFARGALLQRVATYSGGNAWYNFYSATNIGNEGLLVIDPSIAASRSIVRRLRYKARRAWISKPCCRREAPGRWHCRAGRRTLSPAGSRSMAAASMHPPAMRRRRIRRHRSIRVDLAAKALEARATVAAGAVRMIR